MDLGKIYLPVMKEIYEEASNKDNSMINEKIPDIFVPGAGELYEYSDLKVLYIGKDTNGWGSMQKTTSEYAIELNDIKRKEILEEIISRASCKLHENEHLNWWGNGNSQFWDYIFKLQININNLSVNEKFNKEWLEKNEKVTKSFGWGNSYLLQKLNLDESIIKSDFYKTLSKFIYDKYYKESKCFTNMVEALKPDIIIILNWDENENFIGKYTTKVGYIDKCLDGNIRSELSREQLEKIKIVYYELESGQHVFWTYHPHGTLFHGGVDIWVHSMFEFMKYKQFI